jgi:hypothetical protein
MQQSLQKAGGLLGRALALLLLTHCGGGAGSGGPELSDTPAPSTTCQPGMTEWAFEPVADTYVEAGQTAFYGSARKLVADSASERSAFLRFEVAGLRGTVRHAELRLYAIDPSVHGPSLYPVATDWDEDSVTAARPPRVTGPKLADVGEVPDESWVAYDVTAAVRADGAYGFGLFTTSRDGVDFASREYPRAELRPQLRVTAEVTAGDCASGGGAP